jgi:phage repressor protein C with HTH and peptisase S24 domain
MSTPNVIKLLRMDYAEAIRAWRKQAGLSQAALGEALGYGQSRIGNYESRTREPSFEELERIAAYFKASVSEFLLGPKPDKHGVRGTVATPEGGTSEEQYVFIPKVQGVALSAGPGFTSWEHEEVDKSHAFTSAWMRSKGINPRNARIISVVGDSMSPYMLDGDVVLVNLEKTKIRSGEVFAINVEGETRIKRLMRRADGSLEVRSDNPSPQYPPEILRGEEIDRLKIIGMVEWRGG